ncbi:MULTISPECIES: hypothetical protein [unclassified Peribacillus]|uniref:hypothetical protein n=1 Tax=unclassified Peribacillus TaxID=2675266 RepID=UPI001914C6A3|nr:MULTISPECIES: hypothetical protein [unclassified Peribacillus]MBK5446088.1 hypothetical protein [Peribacillus sp. TH24]MBK5497388.1 hypothetical protein [Peribacillus sp. TH14]WMX57471.1 hypothetical protein RE409_09745 [Peribacillus sp. R9-11]
MKAFYSTHADNHYVRNTLITVDQLGMWVEGFQETTVYFDNDLKAVDPPKTEWITYHVLIRWEFIQDVFVVENPSLNENWFR